MASDWKLVCRLLQEALDYAPHYVGKEPRGGGYGAPEKAEFDALMEKVPKQDKALVARFFAFHEHLCVVFNAARNDPIGYHAYSGSTHLLGLVRDALTKP